MTTSDVDRITRLALAMAQHKQLPDDAEHIIDRVADARNPDALPVLRQALNAATEFRRWSEVLSNKVDLTAPGSAPFWTAGLKARRLETQLRSAIRKCTPAGQHVVYH